MFRPKYTKPDENQAEIVEKIRAKGMVVWDTHHAGGYIFDLIVFWKGRCIPVEVKHPGYTDSDFTDKERESMRLLTEMGITFLVATSAEGLENDWPKEE